MSKFLFFLIIDFIFSVNSLQQCVSKIFAKIPGISLTSEIKIKHVNESEFFKRNSLQKDILCYVQKEGQNK